MSDHTVNILHQGSHFLSIIKFLTFRSLPRSKSHFSIPISFVPANVQTALLDNDRLNSASDDSVSRL